MSQIKPEWHEIEEFATMAALLAEKYPERYGSIDVDKIVAYACVNKDRPATKSKPYEMSGQSEPESFTNSKQYFVKLYKDDWLGRTEEQRFALVASALERIDPENPGKIGPWDHKDQAVMLRTFGIDWQDRGDFPHLLKTDVVFRDSE